MMEMSIQYHYDSMKILTVRTMSYRSIISKTNKKVKPNHSFYQKLGMKQTHIWVPFVLKYSFCFMFHCCFKWHNFSHSLSFCFQNQSSWLNQLQHSPKQNRQRIIVFPLLYYLHGRIGSEFNRKFVHHSMHETIIFLLLPLGYGLQQ